MVGANNVGLAGKTLTIDTWGASAPGDRIFKEYGFTVKMQVNFTNHCKKRKSLASPSSFCKYYIELDFLGHSVRMTVSADLAQLVEQRIRNA